MFILYYKCAYGVDSVQQAITSAPRNRPKWTRKRKSNAHTIPRKNQNDVHSRRQASVVTQNIVKLFNMNFSRDDEHKYIYIF